MYRHNRLKKCSAVFLRIVLRSCLNDSKPRDCGFESHRRLFFLSLFLVLNAKYNMVKVFWVFLVKIIANQLDFGEFMPIILYFELSMWTHIEYRVKISTATYTCLCFLIRLTICIPFLIRKMSTFYGTVFFSKFVKMYIIVQ